MEEAIVSTLLVQLTSIAAREIQQEVRLVVGVDEEVEKLKRNLQAIQDVLFDAEQKQVKQRAVRGWLDQLKETSYSIEDVLDEWNTAMMKLQIEGRNDLVPKEKVCLLFPSHCFGIKQVVSRHDIAIKIKKVNEKLDAIATEKDKYNLNVIRNVEKIDQRTQSTSLVDVSEICGRDDEKNILLSKLLSESSDKNNRLRIISIVGMGGIGKTTLAQFLYNDNRVKIAFDKAIWVCVSDPFVPLRVAKEIICGLGVPAPDSEQLEAHTQRICELITDKKILLILDDVWEEDYDKWEPFYHCLKSGPCDNKILITTRNENVARMVKSNDIITIKELTEEYCWMLFARIAFCDRSNEECKKLEDIGRKIVGKCKGLPLAAKAIGSLLHFKKTRGEWQYILDSETWKLKEFEKDIFAPLLLSYNDLPSLVKRCFLYCSIFPKDYEIDKDQLIKLWMAQGYLGLEENKEMEIIGQKYFDHLARRSFFQEFVKDEKDNIISCKMHDILHDFAHFLNKNECFAMELYNEKEPLKISLEQEIVHHSMIILFERECLDFISSFKNLRSLIFCIRCRHSTSIMMLQKLFDRLTYLRALHIGRGLIRFNDFWTIEEIPIGIGKLMHLRYLNLCGHNFKNLPETLCNLYNLQTLDICRCSALEELPQGMGKLKNLRHLLNTHTSSLRYLPMGTERLTCLRTLSEFIVSAASDDSKACTLKSLNYLNHLSGRFKIRKLGNLSDAAEAKLLELKNNKNFFGLALDFEGDRKGKSTDKEDEAILEAIQPHPNLEELEIERYRGGTLPRWITLLSNLRKLTLLWCINYKHLSPLGKLPSLESLKIVGMNGERRVGNEFWGIESDHDTSSSLIFFPKLKYLLIGRIKEWVEWNFKIKRDEEATITIMPGIVSLSIGSCTSLMVLPDILLESTTLKKLNIDYCPLLQDRYNKDTGLNWSKISHIPNIRIGSKYVQGSR